MQANELMIGDWVQNPLGAKGWVKEIRLIPKDSDGFGGYYLVDIAYSKDGDSYARLEAKELNPIPLTPEILEKNGWKHEFDKTNYMVKYDLGNEGKDCWMMWAIKEHNLDIQRQDENLDMYNLKVSRVVTPCDYVHQLQHALRLCGINHEIIL